MKEIIIIKGVMMDNKPKEKTAECASTVSKYLFNLWKEKQNEDGYLIVSDIGEISISLGISIQHLKMYIAYLSIDSHLVQDYKEKTFTVFSQKPFDISINLVITDEELAGFKKADVALEPELFFEFIADHKIDSIKYKPTEMIAERMNNDIFLIEDKNTLYELLPLFDED